MTFSRYRAIDEDMKNGSFETVGGMKPGIYLSADQVAQLMDQAREMREQAEALLATVKADKMGQLDAYYIHRAVQAPRDGNVIDITEHLRKRHESH